MEVCGVDSSGLGYRQVMGCSEHGDELSGSKICRVFFFVFLIASHEVLSKEVRYRFSWSVYGYQYEEYP